uniref:JmjC domain-containing histone demethylation protein 2C n=1 Tax=Trichogramma kaykai TaxID=54128 RepID=A0ABD2WUE2_9HYME
MSEAPIMAKTYQYREELVGKRFLSVNNPDDDKPKLKVSEIEKWDWRAGVIRATTHRENNNEELQVLVEYDGIEWRKREWLQVHREKDFAYFFVEKGLYWSESEGTKESRSSPRHLVEIDRQCSPDNYHNANGLRLNGKSVRAAHKPTKIIPWPVITYYSLVQLEELPVDKRPIEFIQTRRLAFLNSDKLPLVDECWEMTKGVSHWGKAVRRWVELQDTQSILIDTPSLLAGFRVRVYRDGTTQWFTAVVLGAHTNGQDVSMIDDTVLEDHSQDPHLVQIKVIGEGVVESVLRGEAGKRAVRRHRSLMNNKKAKVSPKTGRRRFSSDESIEDLNTLKNEPKKAKNSRTRASGIRPKARKRLLVGGGGKKASSKSTKKETSKESRLEDRENRPSSTTRRLAKPVAVLEETNSPESVEKEDSPAPVDKSRPRRLKASSPAVLDSTEEQSQRPGRRKSRNGLAPRLAAKKCRADIKAEVKAEEDEEAERELEDLFFKGTKLKESSERVKSLAAAKRAASRVAPKPESEVKPQPSEDLDLSKLSLKSKAPRNSLNKLEIVVKQEKEEVDSSNDEPSQLSPDLEAAKRTTSTSSTSDLQSTKATVTAAATAADRKSGGKPILLKREIKDELGAESSTASSLSSRVLDNKSAGPSIIEESPIESEAAAAPAAATSPFKSSKASGGSIRPLKKELLTAASSADSGATSSGVLDNRLSPSGSRSLLLEQQHQEQERARQTESPVILVERLAKKSSAHHQHQREQQQAQPHLLRHQLPAAAAAHASSHHLAHLAPYPHPSLHYAHFPVDPHQHGPGAAAAHLLTQSLLLDCAAREQRSSDEAGAAQDVQEIGASSVPLARYLDSGSDSGVSSVRGTGSGDERSGSRSSAVSAEDASSSSTPNASGNYQSSSASTTATTSATTVAAAAPNSTSSNSSSSSSSSSSGAATAVTAAPARIWHVQSVQHTSLLMAHPQASQAQGHLQPVVPTVGYTGAGGPVPPMPAVPPPPHHHPALAQEMIWRAPSRYHVPMGPHALAAQASLGETILERERLIR